MMTFYCNNSLNQFNFHYSLKLPMPTKPVVSWQHSFWHSKEGIPKKGAKNLNIIDLKLTFRTARH